MQPEGSLACARLGPTVEPAWSPGRKKNIFSKIVPRPLGMLKHAQTNAVLGRSMPHVFRQAAEYCVRSLKSKPIAKELLEAHALGSCFVPADGYYANIFSKEAGKRLMDATAEAQNWGCISILCNVCGGSLGCLPGAMAVGASAVQGSWMAYGEQGLRGM